MDTLNVIRSSDWRRIDTLYNGPEVWSQIYEWEICVLGSVKGPCLSLVLERDYTWSRCVGQSLRGSTIIRSVGCFVYVIIHGSVDSGILPVCAYAPPTLVVFYLLGFFRGIFASQGFSGFGSNFFYVKFLFISHL